MGKKVLIQNARAIVTCDQNDTVCRNADILVNGPEIESIGPSLSGTEQAEGAEVIDVCKAVEEMMNESEERGELRMLVQLVRDGDLKLERAAEKAKMTVEQFEKVMENTPLQAV